jgi:CRP-like cAMP-binding protein
MPAVNFKSNAVLDSLSLGDFELLAPQLRVTSLTQATVLLAENQPGDLAYFPLNGTVSLVAAMRNGACIETGMVGRDGALGLSLRGEHTIPPGRAVVCQPGTAAVIETWKLRNYMREREGIRNSIFACQATLVLYMHTTAACNALHRIENRVARWLLQTFDRVDCATLLLTQEMLAQLIGVRRTTITLVGRNFQQNGSIRYRRGRVELLNRSSLEACACECYEAMQVKPGSHDAHVTLQVNRRDNVEVLSAP